jgi:hypothetical protein
MRVPDTRIYPLRRPNPRLGAGAGGPADQVRG